MKNDTRQQSSDNISSESTDVELYNTNGLRLTRLPTDYILITDESELCSTDISIEPNSSAGQIIEQLEGIWHSIK